MIPDTHLTTPAASVTPGPAGLLARGADDAEGDPSGLEQLCLLTAHAVGAVRVEIRAAAREQVMAAAVGPGTGERGGETCEHTLALSTGDELRLVAHGVPGGDGVASGALVQAAAGCALRLVEAEIVAGHLFDLEDRAARAEQTLVEAAGQLVHDLNNPLAAAAMSVEIARDEVESGLVAQLLDRAASSTARMKRMVLDLLTFSTRPSPGSSTLGSVLQPLADLWNEIEPGRLEVLGAETRVPLSPGDLAIVVVALLENVEKFAVEGGPVRARIVAHEVDRTVVLTVADAGRGVPVADRERVFTPTLRLDRRIPGMGLGLATVRRLVAAAGGAVALEDSELGGVSVRVVLPVV